MRLKAITGILLTILLLVVVSPIGVSVGVVDIQDESKDFAVQSSVDWWPMFHHDLNHTGYSTSTAPNTNNTIWTYTGLWWGSESRAAVVDGKVYVGSRNLKVYCLDALTGTIIWSYKTGHAVWSSPAVAYGKVYVGSEDWKVYCLNALTGAYIWSYETGQQVYSSPAVADGKVYIGSKDQKVYCLNASTGAYIWSYTTGYVVLSSPAVVDGKVYVGSHDGKVYCLNASASSMTPDEREIWNYTTGDWVYSSPAVADGKVYIGSRDQKVYCLNALTGAHIWNHTTGGGVWSSPAVAYGKVYVGSDDNKVYCLSASTGAHIWNYATGGGVFSSPAVADGKVYIGSRDQKVYCLNASTGAYIWSYTTGAQAQSVRSSPAVANGIVYVGGMANTGVDEDTVYAFGPAYTGPVYTLTITTPTGGTTSPSPGTYTYSEDAHAHTSVTAIPYTNCTFDHWELDGFWNYSNPISVTMDSNRTLQAVFIYDNTIKAHCYMEGIDVNVSITMDGSPTGYNTPHNFTGLTGTHTFTVPDTDPHDCPFSGWNTGETNTTITPTTGGTYTAYYGKINVAVTNVTLSKTAVMQGCCVNITVTVENQGNFTETFGVAAPYFDGVVIPTSVQWETFWRMGDVNGDGRIDETDSDILVLVYSGVILDPMWVRLCDLNGDGDVTFFDLGICSLNQGKDIWTHFGLPLPPIGTQRGVRLLDPGNQTTLTLTWNTTGVPYGNYTITAYACPVPGETDTTDNNYTDGWVVVTTGVEVTNVDMSHCGNLVNQAYKTWTVNVSVTIHNNGTIPTNCTVSAYYYNASFTQQIGTSQNITNLDPGNTTTLIFSWNFSILPVGVNYTVKANATYTCGGSDEFVGGLMEKIPWGDVNNNGQVGFLDFGDVGKMYLIYSGVITGPPDLVARGDINGNCVVGYLDFGDVGKMYLIYSGVIS